MEFQLVVERILLVVGIYLGVGVLVAIPFVIAGAKRIDSAAATGTRGFRILIFPGAVLLWPFLLKRWIGGDRDPKEERNAHRRAAGPATPSQSEVSS
ncbi:MAG: hypothetical protein ACI8TQ_001627 [Planctomycetota bacterium]|jgi:hypothetical protein